MAQPGLSVSEAHIENAHVRAMIGLDGTISSLVHKATGREALAGRGNQLWVYPIDKPRNWDAWDIEACTGQMVRAFNDLPGVTPWICGLCIKACPFGQALREY